MSEPMIQKALTAEVLFTTDEIMKRKYEKAEKYRRDYSAHMAYATKQGIKQGIEQGIEQGLEQGITQGKRKQAEATAIEMLQDKANLELIEKYTKLSIEKITELGKQHGLL